MRRTKKENHHNGELDRIFTQIKEDSGKLDIVFANTGIAKMPRLPRLPKRTRTVMEVSMNENMQTAERDKLMSRLWRTIIMWDEAVSTSPIELLEKRVAALEHEVRQSKKFGSQS